MMCLSFHAIGAPVEPISLGTWAGGSGLLSFYCLLFVYLWLPPKTGKSSEPPPSDPSFSSTSHRFLLSGRSPVAWLASRWWDVSSGAQGRDLFAGQTWRRYPVTIQRVDQYRSSCVGFKKKKHAWSTMATFSLLSLNRPQEHCDGNAKNARLLD